MSELYNVYAVNIDTGEKRLIAEGKTLRNAEAVVDMAAICRGVDEEYFFSEPVE